MYPYQTPPPNNPLFAPQKVTSDEKSRGGCLTIWLGVSLAFSLISAVLLLQVLDAFRPGALRPGYRMPFSGFGIILLLGLVVAHIVSLYGAWNWKRWGIYGLGTVIFASPVVETLLGTATATDCFAPIVQVCILWLLVRNKWDYFE